MERIAEIEHILQQTLQEYLKDLQQPANQHLDFVLVADKENKHYQIIAMGWEGYHRIFNLLFHVDVIGNKVWLQEDKMEYSIADRLVENGISKKEIVIGYFPESHRRLSDWAVN